jgi:hypothetical protein
VPWYSSNALLSLYCGDVWFMDGIVVTRVPVTNMLVNYLITVSIKKKEERKLN